MLGSRAYSEFQVVADIDFNDNSSLDGLELSCFQSFASLKSTVGAKPYVRKGKPQTTS